MSNSTSFNPFDTLAKGKTYIPEDLAAACKKVFKKEIVTRLKGFADIKEWIRTSSSIDPFQDEFARIYLESSISADRQIRESCQDLLSTVVRKDRLFLKPLAKSIGTRWLGSTKDPVKNIADAAAQALSECFEEKVGEFTKKFSQVAAAEFPRVLLVDLHHLVERLESSANSAENIEYSKSLCIHSAARAVLASKDTVFTPSDVLDELVNILSSKKIQVFAKESLYELLTTADASNIQTNTISALIKCCFEERNSECLHTALVLAQKLLGPVKPSEFEKQFLTLLKNFLPLSTDKSVWAALTIVAAHFRTTAACEALLSNLKHPVFVERSKLEPFMSLVLKSIELLEVSLQTGQLEKLYRMVLEDSVPLSILSYKFYWDSVQTIWPGSNFLHLLIETLATTPKPFKMIPRLPITDIAEVPEGMELLKSWSSTFELRDALALVKAIGSPVLVSSICERLAASQVFDENENVLNELLTLSSTSSFSAIRDILSSQFPTLNEDKIVEAFHKIKSRHWPTFLTGSRLATLHSVLSHDPKLGLEVFCMIHDLNDDEFDLLLSSDIFNEPDVFSRFKTIVSNNISASRFEKLLAYAYEDTNAGLSEHLHQIFVSKIILKHADVIIKTSLQHHEVFTLLKHYADGTVKEEIFYAIIENAALLKDNIPLDALYSLTVYVDSGLYYFDDILAYDNFAKMLMLVFKNVIYHRNFDLTERSYSKGDLDKLCRIRDKLTSWLSNFTFPNTAECLECWVLSKKLKVRYTYDSIFATFVFGLKFSFENLQMIHEVLPYQNLSPEFLSKFSFMFSIPSDENIPAFQLAILFSEEIKATQFLENLADTLRIDELINLLHTISPLPILKKLDVRSDFLSFMFERVPGLDDSLKELLLHLSAVVCSSGKIDIRFWEARFELLKSLIDHGLEKCTLASISDVSEIIAAYFNKHSDLLFPYSKKLFDLWLSSGESPLFEKPSRNSKVCISRLCQISRDYMTYELSQVDPEQIRNAFIKSSMIENLLAARFYLVLKLDETVENLKAGLSKQLFPWNDFSGVLLQELEPEKKLILFDVFLSYIESVKENFGIFQKYSSYLDAFIGHVMNLLLNLMGWSTKSPLDLSKHEFILLDFEYLLVQGDSETWSVYSAHLFSRLVKACPSATRTKTSDYPKADRDRYIKYFTDYISPVLTARELSRIKRYDQVNSKDSLKLKVLQTSTNCSVSARYTMEDLSVELNIKVHPAFPYEPVEVIGGQRLGISEAKWRTWLLSCQTVFRSDSISILDGLVLWKENVEKSLEGMEACPICYCIFHASDKSLPGPSCKTCNNKYHSSCLYKWFKSSGNATCAMCRAVF